MFISKYFWNFQIIRIIIFELTGIWLQDSNTPFASMSASDHDIPFCNMPKIVFAPFLALVQNPIENLPTLFKLINLLHLGFILAWVSAKIQPGRTYVCFRSPTGRIGRTTHKTTAFNAIYINHRNTASISIIVLGWLALEAHRMSRRFDLFASFCSKQLANSGRMLWNLLCALQLSPAICGFMLEAHVEDYIKDTLWVHRRPHQ